METKKNDLHQGLMDEAYVLWRKHNEWDTKTFIHHLDYQTKIAVILGNLNCQVCNGGFIQWIDNKYAEAHIEDIAMLKNEIDKTKYPEVFEALEMSIKAFEISKDIVYPQNNGGEDDCTDEECEEENNPINKKLDSFDNKFYTFENIETEMNELLNSLIFA